MSGDRPDVIVVTGRHEEAVEADRADLWVSVQGSSAFTGGAAFKQAKELAKLAAALAGCGIGEDKLSLESVYADVSSGLLGKSSSVRYRVRVRCDETSVLPAAIGAVASRKNATLERISWLFPDTAETRGRWLQKCVERAGVKARAIAAALDVDIKGVHRVSELEAYAAQPDRFEALEMAAPMGARSHAIEPGFELVQRREMAAAVTVEYRIG